MKRSFWEVSVQKSENKLAKLVLHGGNAAGYKVFQGFNFPDVFTTFYLQTDSSVRCENPPSRVSATRTAKRDYRLVIGIFLAGKLKQIKV